MADVLIKSDIFSPYGSLCLSFSSRRGKSSFAAFSRCYSSPLEAIRSSSVCGLKGREVLVGEGIGGPMKRNLHAYPAQMSLSIGKALKWWEKGIQLNMKEIWSAQDLVESLQNAGNQLVIVDFFSPGCGCCGALHPKIRQLAEINPDILFLIVHYEGLKSMCCSLNIHVLPFFRFYSGEHGRLFSFSCTNATIKKFKDA